MLKSVLNAVLKKTKTKMAAHIRQFRGGIRRVNRNVRCPRLFRDRSNPLEDLPEDEVFRKYRFNPATILYILQIIPDIATKTQRSNPVPPLLQLLVCLRFLATGAIHTVMGDTTELSRSAAGCCIRRVSAMICDAYRRLIQFPTGMRAVDAKKAFARIAGKQKYKNGIIPNLP